MAKRRKPLGRALSVKANADVVTAKDVLAARKLWARFAPPGFRLLLDATITEYSTTNERRG